MAILHPKTPARKSIPTSAPGDAPPKSIIRGSVTDINKTISGINRSPPRRFYGPITREFWRPPPDVEDALRRGNKKCRASSS